MKHEPQSPPWGKVAGTDIGSGSGAGTGPTDRGPASMATVVLPQPKQIRFVNNEGRPPAKRRRVESACQTCRKRKIRCDGAKPKCNTCVSNRHDCLGYLSLPPTTNQALNGKGPEIKRQESGDTIKNEVDEDGNDLPLLNPGFGDSKKSLTPPQAQPLRRRSTASSHRDENSADRDYKFSDDEAESAQALPRYKVPYFRWFGPTAIVKSGYKQMIVAKEGPRRNGLPPSSSASQASPRSMTQSEDGFLYKQNGRRASFASDSRTVPELPVYDINDTGMPLHILYRHLVDVFFKHLGCNFPFLARDKVMRMVEDRMLAPILVNVICALAARFSKHTLLVSNRNSRSGPAFFGEVFAHRAKQLVTQEFVRPTPEGSQAMLLLAYEAFGADQDSALWHFEGLAIRMVIDVGLQRVEGLRLQRPSYMDPENDPQDESPGCKSESTQPSVTPLEKRDLEEVAKEHVDTVWAIFALDRYISSGLGRRVTMQIHEFELDLPDIARKTTEGLASPFPALIHIMHMYGRVSDILNSINNVEEITSHTRGMISDIEEEMYLFFRSLDSRLQFSIEHFLLYLKHGEGTNLIMLHLWYHTLVILVNCPAVCDDKVVLGSSKISLAVVSAKTIADLCDAAQYADPTVIAGNPFTTQPLYIAACAFLYFMKRGTQNKTSKPSSREDSPEKNNTMGKPPPRAFQGIGKDEEKKREDYNKAAEKGYAQCYAALKHLCKYWAGTRYIITVLDQKAKGVTDPEAFTAEEMESTKVRPSSVTAAARWTRALPLGAPSPSMRSTAMANSPTEGADSPPNAQANQTAQKRLWAMTGTTNSPNSHVTWIPPQHPQTNEEAPSPAPSHTSSYYDPIRSSLPETVRGSNATANYSSYATSAYHPAQHQRIQHGQTMSNYGSYNGESMQQDASLLIDLRNSPHPQPYSRGSGPSQPPYDNNVPQAGASPVNQFTYGDQQTYNYGQVGGPFSQQQHPQQWMQQQYGEMGLGTQQLSYMNTEMDMPTLMQSMDDNAYDLDFLPTEYTERSMGEATWGGYGDMQEDGEGFK